MTRGVLSLRSLLERPVVLQGIRLGDPTDVVLDSLSLRAIGLEVHCRDEVSRFLPLPAARVGDGHLAVGSALMLFEDQEFYRRHALEFRSLCGSAVERDGDVLGELTDLLVDGEGRPVEIQIGSNGSTTRVTIDRSVSIRV
ncbi:MAG TPA: hypothetical protein VM184_06320 [Gaiellaceae bacterium]|nr:hypothetical protein [Gaiellaceae bacterium]